MEKHLQENFNEIPNSFLLVRYPGFVLSIETNCKLLKTIVALKLFKHLQTILTMQHGSQVPGTWFLTTFCSTESFFRNSLILPNGPSSALLLHILSIFIAALNLLSSFFSSFRFSGKMNALP